MFIHALITSLWHIHMPIKINLRTKEVPDRFTQPVLLSLSVKNETTQEL